MRVSEITDPDLRGWVQGRVDRFTHSKRMEFEELVKHWNEADWAAFRIRATTFRESLSEGGRIHDEIKVGRFMAKQPQIEWCGNLYDAPYSQGLHVAALRGERETQRTHWTDSL